MIESDATLTEILNALDAAGVTEAEIRVFKCDKLQPQGVEYLVQGRLGSRGFSLSCVSTLECSSRGTLDDTLRTLYKRTINFLDTMKEKNG